MNLHSNEFAETSERSLDDSHQSLLQMRRGDSTAVAKLMSSIRPFLRYQIAGMIGHDSRRAEDASDLVQKTLLDAIEHMDTFQGESLEQWRSWLCAIAKNKVLDSHRYWTSRKRSTQQVVGGSDTVEQVAASEKTPSSMIVAREDISRLELVMDRLEPEDRQLIKLRHIEGQDHRAIANRLGISEVASRQRLKVAMERLRYAWKTKDV